MLGWLAHIEEDHFTPSKTDRYLIRLAMEMRRMYNLKVKDHSTISESEFELQREGVKKAVTNHDLISAKQRAWLRAGGKGRFDGNRR